MIIELNGRTIKLNNRHVSYLKGEEKGEGYWNGVDQTDQTTVRVWERDIFPKGLRLIPLDAAAPIYTVHEADSRKGTVTFHLSNQHGTLRLDSTVVVDMFELYPDQYISLGG